jgi:hypothetical protein
MKPLGLNLNQGVLSRDQPRLCRRRLSGGQTPIAGLVCFMLAGCAMMLAAGCASIGLLGEGELAAQPRSIAMFVVSTRKGEQDASNEAVENGARYSLRRIGVPPGHEPGKVERPSFGSENPEKHFTVLSRRGLDGTAFYSELASHISGRIGVEPDHGGDAVRRWLSRSTIRR